jgi:hypothetical protein
VIERYHTKDAEQLYGQDFVAMDPGKDGACVVFVSRAPVEVLQTALEPNVISDAMVRHRVSNLLVERQYVGVNAAASLELAWRTGIVLGCIGEQLGGLSLVEVYPPTWQTYQRKKFKIEGRLNRKQGIALSVEEAEVGLINLWETQVAGSRKPVIEGIASAYGIGSWWLGSQVGR